MAFLPRFLFFCLMLLHSIVFIECGQEERYLLLGINLYRSSADLPPLIESDRAHCLANEVVGLLEDTPCTTTTRPQFLDYPDLLETCHFNTTTTRDGQILTACVPNLEPPGSVLSNITKPQNAPFLNDSRFTGIGIWHGNDWAVVVLTTGTHEASDSPGFYLGYILGNESAPQPHIPFLNSDKRACGVTYFSHVVVLLLSFFVLM